MSNQVDEETAFVIASEYRKVVLDHLNDNPATPSAIAESEGIIIAHVSRTLQELTDKGLVALLVPEETHKGRVYGVTEAGEDVLESLEGINT